MRAIPGNRIVATRPLFSRWPEQSVLGQQTVVSGHLEFSLKTTATFYTWQGANYTFIFNVA